MDWSAKVVTMNLPYGRDSLWFPELNVVGLSPLLDDAGRDRALDELQAEWRRSLPRQRSFRMMT